MSDSYRVQTKVHIEVMGKSYMLAEMELPVTTTNGQLDFIGGELSKALHELADKVKEPAE